MTGQPAVYVIRTYSADYYTADRSLAEKTAAKNNGTIERFDNLDAALKEYRALKPIPNGSAYKA